MIAVRTNRRRGVGLIELTVAGILLAAAMAATVQVVGKVARERRAVERRQRAVLEASNQLERIVARPWAELTADSLKSSRIGEAASAALPGATLAVEVTPVEGPDESRRIGVEVRWLDRTGRPEAPVRLVAWVHRREGGGR